MNLKNVSIRNALKVYAVLVAVVCIAMGALSIAKLQAFAAAAGESSIDATLLVAALLVFNVALLMAGAALLFRHIAARIDVIVAGTEDLRAGDCDLTRRLPAMSGNFGKACESLNGFVGQVHDVVASVAATADELATAATQISAGNHELSARTERQASTLEETASSMEEFTASVKQNADHTRVARDLAVRASVAAQRGGEVAAQAVAKIGAANESSRAIGAIVSTIDSIAFQTNILALNAAVEAARAGEQGRGFAVVASEVRALSQRSAAAAKEVKALATDAIDQVDAGAKLAAEAGGAMQEIVEATEKAAAIISDIATLTGQQAAGIEQVNQAIVQLDGVTQQNATLVEHAAAAAASLREQAEGLTILIARFKVRREKRHEAGDRLAQAAYRPAVRERYYVPDASSGHAPRLSTAFVHSAVPVVRGEREEPELEGARPIAVG